MTWPTKTDFADGDVLSAAQVNNIGTNLNEADPTGITDGYVLTADGAGGMGWEALPPSGSMTQIATGNLTGSSVTLTSIPGTYEMLRLFLERPIANTDIRMRINGQTSTLYYSKWSYIGTLSYSTSNDSYFKIRQINGDSVWLQCDFPNYATTSSFKAFLSTSWLTSSSAGEQVVGHYQSSINAITSIELFLNPVYSFTNGKYTLWGIS